MSSVPARPLLVIEDSGEDLAVLLRALREIGFARPVLHFNDAEKALGLLKAGSLNPAIVLLDLNLGGLDGRGFLKRLKAEEKTLTIPVVIFSTSDNPNDVDFCYRNGASGFVLKVMDLQQQTSSLRAILEYWFSAVLLPQQSGRAG